MTDEANVGTGDISTVGASGGGVVYEVVYSSKDVKALERVPKRFTRMLLVL